MATIASAVTNALEYTPPQFAKPAMVTIQPNTTIGGSPYFSSASGGGASVPAAGSVYVFDAVLVLNHDQELTVTSHPVQTGAAINTHAFLQPAELTLDVGMSDAMSAYGAGLSALGTAITGQQVAQWTGASSKSVSCYQTMLRLQRQRVLLNITTRLRTYSNMVVANVRPIENSKTIAGLRMQVRFKQVILASQQASNDSARPGASSTNTLGQVAGQLLSTQISSLFAVPPQVPSVNVAATIGAADFYTWLQAGNTPNVVGAGTFSSLPVQSLQSLPVPS
jgi:hypothetical protein